MSADIDKILKSSYTEVLSNMKDIIGDEKLTKDGYLSMKGKWSDEHKTERIAKNDLLKSYKEQEIALQKISNSYKEMYKTIRDISGENYLIQMAEEDKLAKRKLNNFKKLYNEINNKDRQRYNELHNEEAEIYKTALENKRELTNEELERIKAIHNEKLTSEERINEYVKNLQKTSNDEIVQLTGNLGLIQSKAEEDVAKKRLNEYKQWYDYANDKSREYYRALDEEEAEIYKTALENKRELYDDELERIKEINKEKTKAEKKEQNLKQITGFVKSLTHKIVDSVFKTVNDYSNLMFFDQAKAGMTDFVQAYEQNFTELAGRFGTNRQETHSVIGDSVRAINSDDVLSKALNYNKEVMPAIVAAAQQGFMGDEAIEIGISNALDKKVMPWLNTSSETWSYMQFTMDEDYLNQIKGQQLLLQSTREGNRILQTGIADTLLNQFAPLLTSIELNTTSKEDLGEFYAIAQAQLGDNAPEAMIKETAKSMYDAVYKPFDALTNGTNADKLRAIGYQQTGSVTGMENYLYETVGKQMEAMGDDRIGLGAWFNMLGMNAYAHTQSAVNGAFTSTSESSKYVPGDLTDEELASAYKDSIDSATEKVTATQEHDNKIQNEYAEKILSALTEPHAADIQIDIFNEVVSIKNWLIASLAAEVIGGLLDKGIDKLTNKLFKGKGGTGGSSSGPGVISKLLTGGHGFSGAANIGTSATNLGGGLKGGGLVGGLAQGGSNLTGATGATAAGVGTAAVAGGGLIAGKGIGILGETVNEWDKSSNTDKGVGLATGTAAVAGGGMLAAAGLGLASGPVGWAGLAIGGIALGIKSIYDYHQEFKNACSDVDILGGEFANLRNQVKETAKAKEQELGLLREEFYLTSDEQEQRKLLVESGIIPNTDTLELSTEMMEKYIDKMNNVVSESSQRQDEVLAGLETKYAAESKAEIKGVIDQIYGNLNGKSKDEQRRLLKELGYSDEEINGGFEHGSNGAMSGDELWEFLAMNDTGGWRWGGVDIGSLEEKIESGQISENTLNNYMAKNTNSASRITTREKYMSGLDKIIEAAEYLQRYQSYGRDENPIKAEGVDATGFNQKDYDNYKNYLLGLGEHNKQKIQDVFSEFGIPQDALSDFPNSLKGFKLGSSYVPNDMIAQLHRGERVLTETQNKEYTSEQLSGNSQSSIIQMGVQDIVNAIVQQTQDIINCISSFNPSVTNTNTSSMSMLPAMGNTRVTV